MYTGNGCLINIFVVSQNNIQSKSLKDVLEYASHYHKQYSKNHLRVYSNTPLVTTNNIVEIT